MDRAGRGLAYRLYVRREGTMKAITMSFKATAGELRAAIKAQREETERLLNDEAAVQALRSMLAGGFSSDTIGRAAACLEVA
ncbi:hypothetical protein [Phyllobacterium leguminum]|uniref:Uncharacterized protein n=1 Tax=Phyllobacterium leguminum TaxID=314237 RepID=A0A318T458_9HYPH|nr:hypothetical protein [Phyllobacterium leguminum]PYE86908.1 hypothetical protein C7477_11846 [Phyllobacterium leguminum]